MDILEAKEHATSIEEFEDFIDDKLPELNNIFGWIASAMRESNGIDIPAKEAFCELVVDDPNVLETMVEIGSKLVPVVDLYVNKCTEIMNRQLN